MEPHGGLCASILYQRSVPEDLWLRWSLQLHWNTRVICRLCVCVCVPVASGSFVCSQDNTLDFIEYVAALHLLLRGNLEDRLKWSFKMYDTDGNGMLDRHEVKQIIQVREEKGGGRGRDFSQR